MPRFFAHKSTFRNHSGRHHQPQTSQLLRLGSEQPVEVTTRIICAPIVFFWYNDNYVTMRPCVISIMRGRITTVELLRVFIPAVL